MSARRPIRFGMRSVETLGDRIALLREQVEHGLRDPEMRKLALEIASRCQARDDLCELEAIYRFNQERLRYTGDIASMDTFQTWRASLEFGGGDCDDHLVANATAAAHNGFTSIARVTTAGDSPEHIYVVTAYPKLGPWNGRGIALDTTLPGGRLGDEPPNIRRYWDFPLVG